MKINEKKMYKLLTNFANDSPLAKDMDIEITSYNKSFEAKDKRKGANYNDVILLSDLVRGAEQFLFWVVRKGKI